MLRYRLNCVRHLAGLGNNSEYARPRSTREPCQFLLSPAVISLPEEKAMSATTPLPPPFLSPQWNERVNPQPFRCLVANPHWPSRRPEAQAGTLPRLWDSVAKAILAQIEPKLSDDGISPVKSSNIFIQLPLCCIRSSAEIAQWRCCQWMVDTILLCNARWIRKPNHNPCYPGGKK